MANISFMLERFPGGGTERVVMNLAKPLAECGHKIFLFVHKLQKDKLAEEALPITYIPLCYKLTDRGNFPTIEEAIKRENIDIFFIVGMGLLPKYLGELKRSGWCKIVNVLHSMPFHELVQKEAAIKQPLKKSIFALAKNYLLTLPKFKLGYYDKKVLKKYTTIYQHTDSYGVLFDSFGVALAERLGVESDSSKICTLPNPLPDVEFNLEDAKREKRIVYVGRLTYHDKRLDRLLAVWERLHLRFPEWRLSFVGDGNDEANLKSIVAKKGLQRVEFLGWHNNPFEFYQTSEIMCMTSIVEGCPMAMLEAQQCGCVPVAFECSTGIREILSPNWHSGVYVANGDIAAYAEVLSKLMSDDELRRQIQANGPANAKRFSVEKSVKCYDELIKKLCSE